MKSIKNQKKTIRDNNREIVLFEQKKSDTLEMAKKVFKDVCWRVRSGGMRRGFPPWSFPDEFLFLLLTNKKSAKNGWGVGFEEEDFKPTTV